MSDYNVNEMFPGKYLRADDLPARGKEAEIEAIEQETLNGEKKFIVYFKREERGLVLNKTNALSLAGDFGPNTGDWIGKTVELRVERVQFQGSLVKAIRVYPALDDSAKLGEAIPAQRSRGEVA